jgi:hypothetical protein
MIFPSITWSFGLGIAALLVQQVIKPRLPVYTLQVVRFPSVKYVNKKLLTQLTTDVSLHNYNFVQLNVHALLFDLFTADWDGNLHHIGVVQDSHTAELPLDQLHRHAPSQPIWEIAPRANFTTVDQMYVDITSFSKLLSNLSRLMASWWQGSGSLLLPTTGVAYIKANGQTPITVSLICDNLVNTWRMNIVGLECALFSLNLGWNDMDVAVQKVRDHAQFKLQANATGGVLTHPKQDLSDVIRRVAWEEQMHTTV